MLAAVMPLPSELVTPPVTKTYLGIGSVLRVRLGVGGTACTRAEAPVVYSGGNHTRFPYAAAPILAGMPRRHDPATHVRVAFFRDGRLTSLPGRSRYLAAALGVLADRFEPERAYPEPEVNAVLEGDAPDPATLRRLLVDHGFLERQHGVYRRTP